ncbi:unnamed protein product [Vitrella brassicaformis CCMP3155]|uniref:Uncharacterized protein n=1 Tax=Vitrella brassicaformis (strain CCMP3155) TaxID=1169540 RepID=A0A0G4EJZ9_VITBC|nr:unnamed protein product [Vitrella brassicaformis CCMP3155]|eukprot:CEL96867.1 unnamed protein product [Vitrella brassicaformis CCMP3155]
MTLYQARYMTSSENFEIPRELPPFERVWVWGSGFSFSGTPSHVEMAAVPPHTPTAPPLDEEAPDGAAPLVITDQGFTYLVTPLFTADVSSRHVRASLPRNPIRRFDSIDFYVLILTHQLWYFLPVLFAVVRPSAVGCVAVAVVALGLLAACWRPYSRRMAVVAASCGAQFPHSKAAYHVAGHTLFLIGTSAGLFFASCIDAPLAGAYLFLGGYGMLLLALAARCLESYAASGEQKHELDKANGIVGLEAICCAAVPLLCISVLVGHVRIWWIWVGWLAAIFVLWECWLQFFFALVVCLMTRFLSD